MDGGNTTQAYYDLASGVRLILTPLTLLAQRAINAAIVMQYPYPDKAPYERPVENAFEAGDVLPAEENPDYIAARAAIDEVRTQEFWNRLLDVGADAHNRDELIKQNARLISIMREQIANQPLASQARTDWSILLLSTLATETEVKEIVAAIQGNLPITNAELVDGFRFFRRLDVQGNGLSNPRTE